MNFDYVIIIQLVLLILLVCASGFFSGSEVALFSISRPRLISYKSSNSPARRLISTLMESGNSVLVTIILGNMFVNSMISMLSEELIAGLKLPDLWTLIASMIFSVLILLLFGEVTPMTIAIFNAERIAPKVVYPLWILNRCFSPLIKVVDKLSSMILRLAGPKHSPALSHEEYLSYIDMAEQTKIFTHGEAALLRQTFALREKKAGEIMLPRTEMVCISKNSPLSSLMVSARSRDIKYFPVIKKSLDDAESVLSLRDFFMLSPAERSGWQKSPALLPIVFVPQNSTLAKVMETMKSRKVHVALVADEYGGVSGMLTLERIYEELVGDIQDEHDTPDWQIRKLGENTWIVDGTVSLYLFQELTGWEYPEESDANNINGLCCAELGRIPVKGDRITLPGIELEVLSVRRHCAGDVRVNILETIQKAEQPSYTVNTDEEEGFH